jgi:predicted RNase H-like HicB family nuclease
MVRQYIDRALHRATYEEPDGGTFTGEVPGLQGALAHADTLESCREQLAEVIEERVLVRVSQGLPLPTVDGVTVAVTRTD